MANYKDIHGINIETVASNPDNPANGQVWYNSTDQKLRANSQTTAGVWASAPALNTGRQECGGNGTTTSALLYGGSTYSPAISDTVYQITNTELYNGSSWTEVADLNTARNHLSSTGANATAALAMGGMSYPPGGSVSPGIVEQFNGTSWTEIADLPGARGNGTAFGTTSAAYQLGAQDSAAINEGVDFYNGSSWAAANDINTGRNNAAACGLSTSALLICGFAPGVPARVDNVESFNGTSWSETTDYPAALNALEASGNSSSSAVAFGGNTPPGAGQSLAATYNGSSWTVTGSLANVNAQMGKTSGIPNTAALSFGGNGPPTYRTQTEEFTGAGANSTQEFDLS